VEETPPPRFILGNSVHENSFWKGDIYGLAFYGYDLTSEQVELHFNNWSKEQKFSYANQYKPSLLYLFDEKNRETNRKPTGSHLKY